MPRRQKFYHVLLLLSGNVETQARKGRPLGVFELEPKDLIKENYLTCLKSFAVLRLK